MASAAGDDEYQGTAILVALAKHSAEASVRRNLAQERGYFDRSRKPIAAHRDGLPGLGSFAFMRADQHRRQSVRAARAAHLFEDRIMASHPADGRQRLQMLTPGVGR